MTRTDDTERIAALVGRDVLQITDVGSGWPAFAELLVEGRTEPVALFVGPVGPSHRGRDNVERRFQNPGSGRPIEDPGGGRRLLLLGLWESDEVLDAPRPVLVAADANRRLGNMTRYSIFVGVDALLAARDRGWAEGVNATGEVIRCFAPPLLPLEYVSQRDGVAPPLAALQAAIDGSDLLTVAEAELPAASARARRAGTTLIRDARFSKRVVDAYGGMCAMCGLDIGLVQGAHIYPASAPNSYDEPWNGLALCATHHLAFDKHLIAVRPASREVVVHDDLLAQMATSRAVEAWSEAPSRL